MEEIINIFKNFKDENDDNRERAMLGAIKMLVQLNDDRKFMRAQIEKTNRETRRKNPGIIATRRVICDYIDLIEAMLNKEEIKDKGE